MIEGDNYDTVFTNLADRVFEDPEVRSLRTCYDYRVNKVVLSPLRNRGASEETLRKLSFRSREIFNGRKRMHPPRPVNHKHPPRRENKDKAIRYTDTNVVPRVNGTRR